MPKLLYHFLLVLPANHFQNVVLHLYFQNHVLFSLVLYCNEHLLLFLPLSIWISSFFFLMLGGSPILWSKACLPYQNQKSQTLNFSASLTIRAHRVGSVRCICSRHWLTPVVQRSREELADSSSRGSMVAVLKMALSIGPMSGPNNKAHSQLWY